MIIDYELLPMPQADEMQSLLAEMQVFITSIKDYVTT
jgi:hypothetical protein